MDIDSIISTALPYITSFEGFKGSPYLDQVGVATIGFGTTYYEDGTKVTMGDKPISQLEAERILGGKLKKEFIPGLLKTFHNSDVINTNQYAALLSFEYNEGCGALANSSLAKLVNSGDIEAATSEFPKWDMAGGQHSKGLFDRRMKEQQLFCRPI